MIGKVISRGKAKGVGGLTRYLHGRGEEHAKHRVLDRDGRPQLDKDGQEVEGGRVIGGTVGRWGDTSHQAVTKRLRANSELRPDIDDKAGRSTAKKGAGSMQHLTFSTKAGRDRVLTDSEWRDVVSHYADGMRDKTGKGWAENPYAIVRHDEHHVHVVMNRVRDDGSIWQGQHSGRQLDALSRQVEARHRLGSDQREKPERARTQTDYAKERDGKSSQRDVLAQRVEDALRASESRKTGRGRGAFEDELRTRGVQARPNVSKTGKMNGYSFRLDPSAADNRAVLRGGEPREFAGSKVSRSLSWSKVSARLDTAQAQARTAGSRKGSARPGRGRPAGGRGGGR